ncbi:MAG: OmpA family protein [Reichenbachiella sp.]
MKNLTIRNIVTAVIGLSLLMTLLSHQDVMAASTDADTLSKFQYKQYERAKLRADSYYADLAYVKGIEGYKKALDIWPANDTVKLNIAEGYYLTNNLDSAGYWYEGVIPNEGYQFDDKHYLNYAEILTSKGDYDQARVYYQKFLTTNPTDTRVQERLKGLDRLLDFYGDSVKFEIRHADFNSSGYDFSPSYYDQSIVFISSRETAGAAQFLKPKYDWDKTYFLNIFQLDTAGETQIYNKRIATSYHEGPLSFYDNESKVIFTRNNFRKGELGVRDRKIRIQAADVSESKDGVNKLKLFYSKKGAGGKWIPAEELWFNSDQYSCGHPAVSHDGQRLYFTSDMEGGKGKTDLFVSTWNEDKWGEPKNLIGKINTEGNEMFPFVDENEILYFASDGHEGLGGLDIFRIDLNDPNAAPENMGYPMNTSTDDFGITLRNKGSYQVGYFSSNRAGGLGLDDIYEFKLYLKRNIPGKVVDFFTNEPVADASVEIAMSDGNPDVLSSAKSGGFDYRYAITSDYSIVGGKTGYISDSLIIDPASYTTGDTVLLRLMPELLMIKGQIKEYKTESIMPHAKILVVNETTGERFGMETKEDGKYSFIAASNTKYSFMIKKSMHFTEHDVILTGDQRSGEIIKDEWLLPIVIGEPIGLNDIHYDRRMWDIRPDAAKELDLFVSKLQENPSIIVELSTHTDSRGSDSYNFDLSDKRAKSAAAYVTKHGIESKRIKGQGYGETQLLNECKDGVECTKQQHQNNRRAEFMVTGFLEGFEEDESDVVWVDPNYVTAGLKEHNPDQLMLIGNTGEGELKINGVIVDHESEPVRNALITVFDSNKEVYVQLHSDENGQFEFNSKEDQHYDIVCTKGLLEDKSIEVEIKQQSVDGLSIKMKVSQQ